MLPKPLIDSCHTLANDGVKTLNMPVGIVSHIYNGLYEIVTINSEMGGFIGGVVFPLENTYCRDVYRTDKSALGCVKQRRTLNIQRRTVNGAGS